MGKKKKHEPRFEKIESEFKPDPEYYVIFATNGLELGRMIASSKSEYCKEHQGELVIFNANILTKKRKKIWYGDLNITLDFDNLKNIADQLKEDLYILMEGDARFGYENESLNILLPKARIVIKCNKINKSARKIKRKSSKNNT